MKTWKKAAIGILILLVIGLTIYYLAVREKNPANSCFSMKDKDLLGECAVNQSISTGNIVICSDSRLSSFWKNQCFQSFAEKNKDISLCSNMDSNQTKGYCQFLVAVAAGNATDCDMPFSDYWNDNCHYNLSLGTNASELCHHIIDDDREDECHGEISLINKDFNECRDIQNKTVEMGCIYQHAVLNKNYRICNEMPGNFSRDICVLNIAIKSMNQTICTKIYQKQIILDCLDEIDRLNYEAEVKADYVLNKTNVSADKTDAIIGGTDSIINETGKGITIT